MKFNNLITATAILGLATYSTISMATPTFGEVVGETNAVSLGGSTAPGIKDFGSEYVRLTDLAGGGSATSTSISFSFGYDLENFGLYEFTDTSGVIAKTDMLEVIDFTSPGLFGSNIRMATVSFDLDAPLAWTNGANGVNDNGSNDDVTAIIDRTFGLYATFGGTTYYTHSYLNGGTDSALIFDLNSVSDGVFVAWDDGSGTYSKVGVAVNDVAAVPEPSILALFGLGLVGMGFAVRKRKS